jgi:WD40 repeat protein
MKLFTLVLSVLFITGFTFAQTPVPCTPPAIVFNKNVSNIFNEEQESYLGEIIAETLDKNFVVLQDPVAGAYLQQIGDRLIKNLPPSNIKFKFLIVDAPEINAFNVAGGRIYVTRKLISFVKNEDELAGILGHELGHGIVRHNAIDMTRIFKELLNVDRVGDRQDVFNKFNQFIDQRRSKRLRESQSHEGSQQLEADRIGLIAMAAAGYDPNAVATAWERLTEAKRKGGEGIGDFVGITKREERRLKEILKGIESIPAECRQRSANTGEAAFTQWQADVMSLTRVPYKETVRSVLSKGALRPALPDSVQRFKFSPDGKHILAQDAAGVNVLQREPFSFLFRIPTRNAKAANFTPDSKQIIFQTYGLRVERWDVDTRKAVLIREVYVRDPCLQTSLSPDGTALVCYNIEGSLELIDVNTSEKTYSHPNFYKPTFIDMINWRLMLGEESASEINELEMQFSPNGQYLVASKVFRMPLGIGIRFIQPPGKDFYVAYDLKARQELKLSENLKSVLIAPFVFYGNDQLLAQHPLDPEKSGLFTFPGGERIEQFYLNAQSYEKPSGADYILVRPVNGRPVGAFNIAQRKVFLTNKSPAIDGHGDFLISEGTSGLVELLRLQDAKLERVGSIGVPRSELGNIRAIAVSDDFNTLAVSGSGRGGVWNLKTGEIRLFVRAFNGAYVAPGGSVYAEFPASEGEVRSVVKMDAATGTVDKPNPIDHRGGLQHGQLLVRMITETQKQLESAEKGGAEAKNDKKKKSSGEWKPIITNFNFRSFTIPNMTLEVFDIQSRELLWSSHFENEAPKYSFNSKAGTASLFWRLNTQTAKDIIRKSPALSARLKTLAEKEGDYLVQVVNAKTGQEIGATLIETGEGSFSIERITAEGDWLTITDSENRILFYSLKTGELKSRVFGENSAVSPSQSIAAVENIAGVLSIVDMNTGKRIDELRFPSRIAYSTFNSQGDKLFVFTANQQYYIFDASQFRVS